MGLDVKRFSGDIDDFQCPICQDIIEDPIACQSEHIFCKSCIDEWLQTSSSCPVDRQPLNNSELLEPPRFFRNCYAKLVLKCEFDLHGCSTNCKIEDVVSHQNKCDFNPNVKHKCKKGCDALLSRAESAEHKCPIHLNSITQQKIKIQPKPNIVQLFRSSARTMVLNQADPPRSLRGSTRPSHRGGSHTGGRQRGAQTHGGHQRGVQTHRGHQRGGQTHGGHQRGSQTHRDDQRGSQTHRDDQRGSQTQRDDQRAAHHTIRKLFYL